MLASAIYMLKEDIKIKDSNYSGVVLSLLEHGADVNAIDNKGRTALTYALEGSDTFEDPKCLYNKEQQKLNTEIRKILIDNGAVEKVKITEELSK